MYEDADLFEFYNQDWKEIIENLEPSTTTGKGGGYQHTINFMFIKKYNRIVFDKSNDCYSITFDGKTFKNEHEFKDAGEGFEKLDDDTYLGRKGDDLNIVAAANFSVVKQKFPKHSKNLVAYKLILPDYFIALYQDLIQVWNWKDFTCGAEKLVADKSSKDWFTCLCAVNE